MFTNAKIATTALIAVSLSMGLSACSPPQNNDTPPTTSASATASETAIPLASEDVAPANPATALPSETASSTADVSDAADPSRTAEVANETLNDFMTSIKVETLKIAADPEAAAAMTPEEIENAFAYSTAYMDTSKFTKDQVGGIIGGFASIYMVDSNATIVSKDADAMKVSGDTASIEGNAFTVTLNGVEKKGKAGSGGSMTLTHANGDWKITGYGAGPSSK